MPSSIGQLVLALCQWARSPGARPLWLALAPGGLLLVIALLGYRAFRARRARTGGRAQPGSICSSEQLSIFVQSRRQQRAEPGKPGPPGAG